MHAYIPSTQEVKAGGSKIKIIIGCTADLSLAWQHEALYKKQFPLILVCDTN